MFVLIRKCNVSLSRLILIRHNSLRVQTLSLSSSATTAGYLTNSSDNISPETALKVSSTVSRLKHSLRTDSVQSCFKEIGFSAPQIHRMINKYPRILKISPLILKDKLSVFQDKGLSTRDTIAIIYKNPRILFRSSVNRLEPSIDALNTAFGSTLTACRVLKKLPWILEKDLRKNMIPNIEFLKNCSDLSSSQVADFMMRFPRLFLLRPETVEEGARKVCKMGLEWTSKAYLNAIRVMCYLSEEKLEHRMRFFQRLGFLESDVLRMFNKSQNVFCSSEKNITETIKELLGWGRADISLLKKRTVLLTYSVEKRIKPRLEVIKVLDERGLLPKYPGLFKILQLTNKEFMGTFVLSNSNALGDDGVIRIRSILSGKSLKT